MFRPLQGVSSSISIGMIEWRYEGLQTYDEVCTISFEQPVNYLCDAWHVFPPKYEAWAHVNRP